MDPDFRFDPDGSDDDGAAPSAAAGRRKPAQSPWEFSSYAESVAAEHARRRTTSIDEKISQALSGSRRGGKPSIPDGDSEGDEDDSEVEDDSEEDDKEVVEGEIEDEEDEVEESEDDDEGVEVSDEEVEELEEGKGEEKSDEVEEGEEGQDGEEEEKEEGDEEAAEEVSLVAAIPFLHFFPLNLAPDALLAHYAVKFKCNVVSHELFSCNNRDMLMHWYSQEEETDKKSGVVDPSKFFASSEGASFHANSFLELNLSRPLLRACEALGYQKPTPIQVYNCELLFAHE